MVNFISSETLLRLLLLHVSDAKGKVRGRGLHSSTFQLSLRRSLHKIRPNYPLTPPKRPLNHPPMHSLSHRKRSR